MKRTHHTNDPAGRTVPASTDEPVYGFGLDAMPLREALARLSGTDVYSERTSSLALAQFLLPSPGLDWLLERLILFCNRDDGLDPVDIARFFEYPVEPRHSRTGRPIARALASMSDAMFLAEGFRAAVEGKWTETGHRYETVREWLAKGRSRAVLDGWLADLDGASAIRPGFDRDGFLDVPYQLVHRAASACRGVRRGSHVRPAVCYVVFRAADASPEESAAPHAFEESLLGCWTDWVDTDSLEVVLVRVSVVRCPPPMDGAAASRLFLDIAAGARPYGFDWDGVTLRRLSDVRSAGCGRGDETTAAD